MGYNIKQKMEICLKYEAEPHMTQTDLANWAMQQYGSSKPPSQTTISRILKSRNEIIGAKEADFQLVRRRKQSNPLLRKILTEWITQAHWEQIPITTPIIQLTAYAIWTRLPASMKDGNGMFNHKWCNSFVKKLNINLTGSAAAIADNKGYKLNKEWKLDEKLELKTYIRWLIAEKNYEPRDLFTIDEFSLFYLLPLDQIFDISSIDKGLKQSSLSTENMLTVMLGCNIDGSEKLHPLVVSKHETFDVASSSHPGLRSQNVEHLSAQALINKVGETYSISYKSNNNKWITSSMFQDYLLTLDHKLENSTPDRHIAILLDNSSSHRMINLEFKHIRLVYLENTSKHKNPFNGLNSAKFDYLPMSFGIVEQFKILYRLQQYLEMINKQRSNVESDDLGQPKLGSSLSSPSVRATHETDVLAERDYQVPFIKVIEWIRRLWDSISPQMIFSAWAQTYLINFRQPWPAADPNVAQSATKYIATLVAGLPNYDSQKSYDKLKEIMKYLNVVIPWEIDELLGLVNERSKVSLSYASIEEIIGSCVLGESDEPDSRDPKSAPPDLTQDLWFVDSPSISLPEPRLNFGLRVLDSPLTAKMPLAPLLLAPLTSYSQQGRSAASPPRQFDATPTQTKFPSFPDYNSGSVNMNALLMATNVSRHEDNQANLALLGPSKSDLLPPVLARVDMNQKNRMGDFTKSDYLSERKSELGMPDRKRPQYVSPYYSAPVLPVMDTSDMRSQSPLPSSVRSVNRSLLGRVPVEGNSDAELIGVLNRLIDASNSDGVKLSSFALEELKSNLSKIQSKYGNLPGI